VGEDVTANLGTIGSIPKVLAGRLADYRLLEVRGEEVLKALGEARFRTESHPCASLDEVIETCEAREAERDQLEYEAPRLGVRILDEAEFLGMVGAES